MASPIVVAARRLGLLVVSDIKWPANQEIDRVTARFRPKARIWTGLMCALDDFRRGNGSICSS